MKTEIKSMIKDLDNTDVQNHNLHFFIGATSILAFIAKTFFQPGDTVSVDTPLYAEIQGDFESRVTLKYVHENLFKGTLLKRVIRAKEDGSKGYVIVNANNPTGYAYPQSEIREVGEWAAKNTDFTIVFDEMYINLVHGKAKTCSSVEYAVQSPNVQTIRGFAK